MSRLTERLAGIFSKSGLVSGSKRIFRSSASSAGPRRTNLAAASTTGGVRFTSDPDDAENRSDDQAARLRQAVNGSGHVRHDDDQPDDSTESGPSDSASSPAVASDDSEIVTRSSIARDFLPTRKRDRQEAQARTYEQMAKLIERIDQHLDAQAERSGRMVALLEKLPDALTSIPEIRRHGEKIATSLEQHFQSQQDRDERLRTTLAELSAGTGQQAEALTLIQREIRAGRERESQMAEVLSDFRDTLTSVSATNEQSIVALRELASAARQRQSRLTAVLEKQSRVVMIIAGAAIVGSLAAIVASIVAIASL